MTPPVPRRSFTAFWTSSTYFAEGLPYSVVHQISAQFFTASGASLQAIGLTSLYGLAWNFKFLWSPLIDVFSNKKRWLVSLELLIALAIAILTWPALGLNLGMAAKIFVMIAFLAATHDMAVDGFYIQSLNDKEQAAFSGLRVAAYRISLLVGNGALVILAGLASWATCFLAAAGIMGSLALWHQWFLPKAQAMGTVFKASLMEEAFVSYLKQPYIIRILAFVLVYRAGDSMMFAMATPFLKELGYDTAARGFLSGMLGTLSGISGALIGGAVISRSGLRRCLFPFTLIQSLSIPAYAWLAYFKPGLFGVGLVIAFEQLAAGIGTAGLLVFLMQRCSRSFQATHFAIGTALMSVAATLAGSVSGYVASSVGYVLFFSIAFIISWPGVIMAWMMPARVHHY
jgi:PAT family beta-lactamase induction signal transducer AmpG